MLMNKTEIDRGFDRMKAQAKRAKRSVLNLDLLRMKTAEFLKKWKANGKPTARYRCPRCLKSIETIRPSPGDVGDSRRGWTSMKTCTNCGDLAMVVVPVVGRCSVIL
jgi:uncharacterized protein with PIN domain